MEKLIKVAGVAAPFLEDNCNTDAIIPVSWMRSPSSDFGRGLFGSRRYDRQGNEIESFILNQSPFRKAKIIVSRKNFGCGSSREAAVWALYQFGIRVVVAESFGDIFFENAFKNGLLPVTLAKDQVDQLLSWISDQTVPLLSVDLLSCTLSFDEEAIPFKVAAERRTALLEGLDEIGQTLEYQTDLDSFDLGHKTKRPWIYCPRPPIAEAAD